ncbi:MAG: polysaccharide pyruvyl transferase family protein [Ignavibacteria bacterium]|nr:polysaccharide pyruvyl transferase family protein [Ignavibacteria bacterium]
METAALITTCGHNIGDDMVRKGILYLLEETGRTYRPELIHKHFPVTVRKRCGWIHASGVTRVLDRISSRINPHLSEVLDRLPINQRFDKILSADLIVQCGAPVFWCFDDGNGAHRNEWYVPLMIKRYKAFGRRVPFLNIGAGSCQPYGNNGSECSTNRECRAYISDLHAAASLTVVRDPLAGNILSGLGLEAVLLPCPSLFARDRLNVDPGPSEYVAVNFMPLGGHYTLGQEINPARWRSEFGSFLRASSTSVRLVLACHTRHEFAVARRYFPDVPRRFLATAEESLRFYSKASTFVGSRVHGAMAVASFGRPAFVAGNDTRARTVEPIGCAHSFVEQTDAKSLETALSRMLNDAEHFAGRMEKIRKETYLRYMDIFSFLNEPVSGMAGA